jgi:predicted regulator of Ras-like GTPase activity (Roadblock/LC7/MglB family)
MRQPIAAPTDLAWLLDDLVNRVVGVQYAIVLSNDGLLLAASRGLIREQAETMAAAASGIQSLARGHGRMAAVGEPRQTVVEYDGGNLFICDAADNSCLAAQSTDQVDVGVLAFEMARLVTGVSSFLGTATRTAG